MSDKEPKLAPGVMPKLEWDQQYSVGIDRFDKEHMVLFEYINDLRDIMLGKKGEEATVKLFRSIMDYAIDHFSGEEVEMYRYKYPKFTEHKNKHDAFTSAAKELYVRYRGGESNTTMVAIEVTALLTEWLQDHILNDDKEYAAFYIEQGIAVK